MKPAPFAYHVPRTLEETLSLLRSIDGAKVLAGGQSLVPLMNFRLARPSALVDLNRVAGLDTLTVEDGYLRIGALVRQRQAERSALVAQACPLMSKALPFIGHEAIRTRGTVCGSLAHADPSAELPAVICAVEAICVAASLHGMREIPAGEFFAGYLTTALAPDEVLAEVRIPIYPGTWRWTFHEMARRPGDFALVGLAAGVRLEEGRILDTRLVFTGVGPTPVRPVAAEQVLTQLLGSAAIEAAIAEARKAIDPEGDVHASRDFRIHLAGVLVRRALKELTEVRRGKVS